jgi:hypothetical protein
MAYLILNDKNAYADEWDNVEKWYEFDPSDKIAADRIHRIFSLRKYGVIQNSEAVLADICEKTLVPAQIAKSRPLTRRLLEQAKKFLGSAPYTRKKVLHKQSPAKPVYSCKCLSYPSFLQ